MGLCELDEGRIDDFRRRHPGVWIERELDTALADPRVEAVAIATPPHTHFAAGQPRSRSRQARPGREAAGPAPPRRRRSWSRWPSERGLVLMPGHTFLYSPAVNKVRDLIQDDELGEIYFVTSSRMNLGLYQQDGVVLDLAPHDLSILLHWLGKPLVEVSATRPQRLPGGRPRDRLPHPALRGRHPGQRPALLAGAAQGAPDGRGRQPADGPVRGHRRRRLGAHLRPRPRLRRAARQLRRVPPDLPHRRHGRPAARRPWSHSARSSATSPRRSARAPRRSPTRRLGVEIVLGLEALEQSLHAQGEPVPVASVDSVLSAARGEIATV